MPTLTKRGSGTPVTSGTTWTTTTNAVDGTPPANPATYAVWTSSTSGATAYIEITNYDFSTIPDNAIISSVIATVRHFENNVSRIPTVSLQAYLGATPTGTAKTCTVATSARDDATVTIPVTVAQLKGGTFKLRVTATRAAVTQSATFNVDHIDVAVVYTVPAIVTGTSAPALTINVTATGTVTTPPPPPPFSAVGLEGWYDATVDSAFTYSNGNDPGNPPLTYVSQWNDMSGQDNHASSYLPNAGYHPKRNVTINGKKAIDFSTGYIGVTKALSVPGIDGKSKPCTHVMIARMPATIIDNGILIGSAQGGLCLRIFSDGRLDMVIPGIAQINGARTAVGSVVPSTDYLISWSYSATGDFWIRVNKVQLVSGNSNATPTATDGPGLGSGSNTGGSFGGFVGEAVIYNRVIDSAEITEVENYLYNRWLYVAPVVTGVATSDVVIDVQAVGTVITPPVVTGTSSIVLTLDVVATGQVIAEIVSGSSSVPISILVSAVGTVVAEIISGTAVTQVGISVVATGTRIVYGTGPGGGLGAEQRPTVGGAPTGKSGGEKGCRYTFAQAGQVTRVRYQRIATCPDVQTIRVWNGAGVKIAEKADSRPAGVGAFEVTLDIPLAVVAGTYTFSIGSADSPVYGPGGNSVTNTADITFVNHFRNSTEGVYPTDGALGGNHYVEPIFQTLTGSGPMTTVAFAATASGARVISGTASVSISFGVAVAGTVVAEVVSGVAVASFSVDVVAIGTRVVSGTSVISLTVSAIATGVTVGPVLAASSISISLSITAVGTRIVSGTSVISINTSVVGVGQRVVNGVSIVTVGLTTTTVGTRIVMGTSNVPIVIETTAIGVVVAEIISGTASISVIFSVSAVGTVIIPSVFAGQWNGQEVVEMQYGPDEVVEWMLI